MTNKLTLSDYQKLAVETLGPDRDSRNLALGVVGEAGEVADEADQPLSGGVARIAELIKKGFRPGRTVNKELLGYEIGDELWYLAVLADDNGLDFGEIAEDNIEKLNKRYGK